MPYPSNPQLIRSTSQLICSTFLSTLIVFGVLLCDTTLAQGDAELERRRVDFSEQIQPLLRRHCQRCHGEKHDEGGLRLNQRDDVIGEAAGRADDRSRGTACELHSHQGITAGRELVPRFHTM